MKKIILFLALALGVKVNAQIVGGYLPVNSSKSATVGALRVNGAITATGTIKTGSTTIQGGTASATVQMPASSGTLANLSDALFPVNLNHVASNPADATEYYLGNNSFLYASGVSGSITIPYNCTLVSWNISVVNTGGNGTAGNATVSISGTTNYTLSTAINYTTVTQAFSGSGLSQNFSAGDVFNIKILTPTWATNPLSTFHGVTLWFIRRS